MTPSERTGLAWLWILEGGLTTRELANSIGRSIRLVQLYTKAGREWLKRRRERIEIVMGGVVGACEHGLPVLTVRSQSTWVCADCSATNHPDHPAFQRGDPVGFQAKAPPKSKLASPSEVPNLKRRATKSSKKTS